MNLDTITRVEISAWKPGHTLLLSGGMLTGRDAAHARMARMLDAGESLPVNFRSRFIYHVGPVDVIAGEAVGPAEGPTTTTRMDRFTETILARTGLMGMIGKAETGPTALEAIARQRAVYLVANGGPADPVPKAIRSARVLAFAGLGMEAIYEDMPVTVGVDVNGNLRPSVRTAKMAPSHRGESGSRPEQQCIGPRSARVG